MLKILNLTTTVLDIRTGVRKAATLTAVGLLLLSLSACHSKKSAPVTTPTTTIITAKMQTPVTQLYYNATIAPISSRSVFSPIDARINKILFKYGQTVKKGDMLFLLSSTELIDNYRKAVTTYLQSKEDYQNGLISFQGSQMLFKAQIISKEEFANEHASIDAKALSYNQAIYDLEKLLSKAGISAKEIEQLSLNNIEAVNQILNKQFGSIAIHAPVNGVALFPIGGQGQKEGGGGGGEGNGKIKAGDEVKADQLVLSIGDLEGFSVRFSVSEININQVKVGLPATVTGDAFPGIVLKGQVSAATSQAKPSSTSMDGGGGLSMFDVEVKIPHISQTARDTIRIGMSAKVELDIPGKPQITLPVNAVFTKNNQSMITKVDAQGQQQDVPVVTGQTSINDVTIVSGVKTGDRILIHPPAPPPSSTSSGS